MPIPRVGLVAATLLLAGCAGDDSPAGPIAGPGGSSTAVGGAIVTETVGAACRAGAPAPGVFTEVSDQLGLDFEHLAQAPPSREQPDGRLLDYAGVGLADLDGDGALDLFFTNAGGPDRMYVTGGRGPAAFQPVDLDVEPWSSHGVVLGDIDGDGDVDAVVSTDTDPYVLYNDGTGRLTRSVILNTALSESDETYGIYSLALGDLDGDGWLDIYVGVHEEQGDFDPIARPGSEWWMRSDRHGTFVDRSDRIPVRRVDDKTFLVCVLDLDDDGDLDIYEVNDVTSLAILGIDPSDSEPQGNRLYRNDGLDAEGKLTLVDISEESGAGITTSGMGAAVGDYDNDGRMDFYVTSMLPDPNFLLHNDGDMRFSDRTAESGSMTLGPTHDVAWGAVFFDADMDGWPDLFVTHGWNIQGVYPSGVPVNLDRQPNVLLHNRDQGRHFEDVSAAAGLDGPDWSRSPAVGDIDRDGFPDLVVGNAQARPYVYLNGCDGRAWLTVALADNPPNGAAIGARVRVTAAGMVQTRHILGGSEGLYGTSAPEAYFGFGTATVGTADVEVRWPDGRVTTHAGVQTRRHVTIRRQSP